jgi:hypothetical protein
MLISSRIRASPRSSHCCEATGVKKARAASWPDSGSTVDFKNARTRASGSMSACGTGAALVAPSRWKDLMGCGEESLGIDPHADTTTIATVAVATAIRSPRTLRRGCSG